MTDLRQLSDDDLKRIYEQKKAQQQTRDISAMSDDALRDQLMQRKAERFRQPTNQGPAYDAFAERHPIASRAATFLQGVPFVGEFADEGLAKVSNWLGLMPEDQAKTAIRTMQTRQAENHPYETMALQGAGGLTGAGIAAAAAGPSLMAAAPQTMAGKSAVGLGLGVLGGGLEGSISGYGAGVGEGRARSAMQRGATSALIAGPLGALAPIVSKGVEKAVTAPIAKALMQGKVSRQSGLSKGARSALVRALGADDLSQGVKNIRRGGADAMVADAGPNARALLDVSIQRSGPGARIAKDAVEARAAAANKRIAKALDDTLGAPKGVKTTETALRKGTASARNAAYQAAYSRPIDYSDAMGIEIEGLVARAPQQAIARANQLMKLEGANSKQILARIADDGSVAFEQLPDVQQLDYITRALNDLASSGEGQGALGGQTALGRSLQNLSRDIRDRLKNLVPEYKVALDTAAEPIAAREALKTGQSMLSRSRTRDDIADALRGASGAERRFAAQGVRSNIDDVVAETTRAIGDSNMDAREAVSGIRRLSSRANREKLAMLLGKDKAGGLMDEIDSASQALQLRADVAQNSKTFARDTLNRAIKEQTEPGVIGTAAAGKPVNALQTMLQKATGQTPEDILARQDEIFREVAQVLTGPRGEAAAQLLDQINTLAKTDPMVAELAKRLAGAGVAGVAVPAYQIGTIKSGQ